MLEASFTTRRLQFAFVAHTSRETFRQKVTYYVRVSNGTVNGVGEVAVFPSLQPSFTSFDKFEILLRDVCRDIEEYVNGRHWPDNSAVRFGFETALGDLAHGGRHLPFGVNEWCEGKRPLLINGLVWMNDVETMERQIGEKIDAGFKCLKLKIGALDFERELAMIRYIRSTFPVSTLEIRLDANGAFKSDNVAQKLERLSSYDIHSLEQPLPRNSLSMARTITDSPIPIALDEDMIERWWSVERMTDWLGNLNPAYIIIKPSLCGGFEIADTWIDVARNLGIGWWATSALESNVGLNAIGQWLGSRSDAWDMRQGLGTGQIYTNNIASPIVQQGERLIYQSTGQWDAI